MAKLLSVSALKGSSLPSTGSRFASTYLLSDPATRSTEGTFRKPNDSKHIFLSASLLGALSVGKRRRFNSQTKAQGSQEASISATSYNKAVGGRLRIKQILNSDDGGKSLIGSKVTVCGWVRTVRTQKGLTFLKVNDGSTFQEIQAVVLDTAKGYSELCLQGTGASVRIEGVIVESPAEGQAVEISCATADHSVEVLGSVDSKTYPLAKKSHTIEYLRSIAHLRPRSNLIGAVSRVRNSLAMSTHRFFQDKGFLYVHTPILTTSDCEGAGEMFRVSVADESQAAASPSKEFFGRPTFLTVSGQLAVENFCCSLGDVYTFGPTFRAENSSTPRHLAEFWMIEPEMAFANLQDDMDCAEDYIRFCIRTLLETCQSDLDFFTQRIDKEVRTRLQKIEEKPFTRISYTEAVEILQKYIQSGEAKFEFEVAWGKELQTEHEKWLTDVVYKGPVIVYNYPKDCKAFYMRLNDDGKTVAAMDILCPGIGELVGGSQREERLEVLDARLEAMNLRKEDYWWYRDLRQYGSVPHAGFGVGFERLIMLCTGVQNIRDVIPFPRYPGHADF
jgi:asparaginyl-tRNA synthetase